MLFHVYGENALPQWIAMLGVLAALILLNEVARRTKAGGIFMFFVIPAILTVYFIAIAVGAKTGASWALNNQTYLYMNGWFHYAKLYAALAGCIGFMMIKYEWGIGKAHWFKAYPFAIVAINILIAVASDFESAINGWYSWWLSSEDIWLYGGWHNVFNGIAGIINILCMTGWWAVYTSKDKKDMIWPDMIWVYILVYDVWNFAYTYNCLPTHSWFCGVALLLAPTIAALLWNKGGWIMNRANTLCIWCMFAQVFPLFQETFSDGTQVFPWATIPKLYADGTLNGITAGGSTNADPTMMTIVSLLALIVNIVAFIYIIRTARKKKKNPYNTTRMQLQELRLNKKQGRPAKALFHFCGANFICFFPVPFEFFLPFPDTHLPLLILHIRPLSPTATEDFPVDIPVSVKYFHSIPVCQSKLESLSFFLVQYSDTP